MDYFQKLPSILQGKVEVASLMPYKDKIEALSDEKITQIQLLDLRSPIVGFLLGFIPPFLFLGLNFDRLYKGDTGLFVFKIMLWLWMLVNFFLAFIFLWDDSGSLREYIQLMITSLCSSVIILFIWNLVDFFLVWQGIKKDNLKKIVNFLEQDENFISNEQ
ncbi:hypothetical protein [Campylobacter sp. US33a]|uniref:hypothetical protein n=1 Tax=Campylobacter sp. US33a TaxID=2498120 RepID=UPI0010679ADB|nr:hypothetical protein [Campylobacter sp. US33a]TEY04039.1 hypothetical protein ELQ16_02025 [Campylobacter sp. US33a]